jgi:pyridoxal phosphate enzyme, yggS family
MTELQEKLAEVRANIAEAAKNAGRDAASVRLLAVSKTFPADDVLEALAAGQIEFGENRVQELETKVPVCGPETVWHLIGHLQTNKAEKAVGLAEYIHSVDSVKLLNRINAAAEKHGKRQKLLLEVNVSGEESKFGLSGYDAVRETAEHALSLANVQLLGLMTMAPLDAPDSVLHATFGGLREFRDRLEREFSIRLPELSMGMSHDYPIAIAEGATIVRIGTAIFGGRNYNV